MRTTMSISEFFEGCRTRGPMPLKAHLNSTKFQDEVEARAMRGRTLAALKTEKWSDLTGNIILADGSRSEVFLGQEIVQNKVPAPIRPASLTAQPIAAIAEQNAFRLPSTQFLTETTATEMATLPLNKQVTLVAGWKALNDERVLEQTEARHKEELRKAAQEGWDEARRDKIWLQQMLTSGDGGKGGITKG